MQDQLLVLPFGLAGGALTGVKPSEHRRTAADIVQRFTGRTVRFGERTTGEQRVEIR